MSIQQMRPSPIWPESLPERFWAKVDRSGGCWLWTGALGRDGYARTKVYGQKWSVHRIGYELQIGPIPEGMTLDHLCRVRSCVRGDHLEPVPMKVNNLRGFSPTADNARKTHCNRGHPYDHLNTYFDKNGWRQCRACRLRRSLARHGGFKHLVSP